MKITALMVASVDGKITRDSGESIYDWTSPEDQEQFFATIRSARVIVMGRRTWQAARDKIVLQPETLRVVLTSRPTEFAAESVPGQLEFSALKPRELVTKLAADGREQILVVGGAQVLGAFLADQLIDELQLTVEPWLFGSGMALLPERSINAQLQLIELRKLNARGTLLLRYAVASTV